MNDKLTDTNNINSAIKTHIDERGVATLTLNRPEKHNAFDDIVIQQLSQALTAFDDNPDVRIIILASEGKSFSAGADLAWMKRMASYSYEDNLSDARALADMLKLLNSLSKPTIARVAGAAYGGAVGLVSCCDIAIASPRASFCLSEVKLGLVPATISPYVIAAIGQRAARRYFLTAERFDAKQALSLGLLSEVVEQATLDTTIDDIVNQLLNNGPQAMSAAKQLIFDVADKEINETLIEKTSALIASIRVSDQGQQGLTAFFEKRTPNWRLKPHSDDGPSSKDTPSTIAPQTPARGKSDV